MRRILQQAPRTLFCFSLLINFALSAMAAEPTFRSAVFVGGQGQQGGGSENATMSFPAGIALNRGQLYFAGEDQSQAGAHALTVQVSLPPSPAAIRSSLWPEKASSAGPHQEVLSAVAATSEGVYFAGRSLSQTQDPQAPKEHRCVLIKFPPDNAVGQGAGRALWTRSVDFFPTPVWKESGPEAFLSVLAVEEEGQVFIYAGGYAQAGKQNHTAVLAKFDSSGNLIWKEIVGEPGDGFHSSVSSLAELDGHIYAAGKSHYTDSNYDHRATLWKIARTGGMVWFKTYTQSLKPEGAAVAVTASEDHVFLASSQFIGPYGAEDVLILKYTPSGRFVWSSKWGGQGTDVGHGILYSDGKLFVVGETTSFQAAGKDAFMLVVDPDFGKVQTYSLMGWEEDDVARAVAVQDGELFVVGETTSSREQGNLPGAKDFMVLHYSLGEVAAPVISASTMGTGVAAVAVQAEPVPQGPTPEEQLALVKEEMSALREQSKTELEALKAQLEQAEARAKELRSTAGSQEGQLAQLNNQLASAQGQAKEQSQLAQSRLDELQIIRTALREKEHALVRAQTEQAALETRWVQYRAEVLAQEEDAQLGSKKIQDQLSAMEQTLEQTKLEKNLLQEEKTQLQERQKRIAGELEQANEELNRAKKEIAGLRAQLGSAQEVQVAQEATEQQLDAARQEIGRLRKAVSYSEEQLTGMQTQNEALAQAKGETQSQLQELISENLLLDDTIGRLENNVAVQTAQLEELQAALKRSSNENEKIRELEAQLARMQEDLEGMRANYMASEEEVQSLRSMLEQTQGVGPDIGVRLGAPVPEAAEAAMPTLDVPGPALEKPPGLHVELLTWDHMGQPQKVLERLQRLRIVIVSEIDGAPSSADMDLQILAPDGSVIDEFSQSTGTEGSVVVFRSLALADFPAGVYSIVAKARAQGHNPVTAYTHFGHKVEEAEVLEAPSPIVEAPVLPVLAPLEALMLTLDRKGNPDSEFKRLKKLRIAVLSSSKGSPVASTVEVVVTGPDGSVIDTFAKAASESGELNIERPLEREIDKGTYTIKGLVAAEGYEPATVTHQFVVN
ncbi:MAG: hypothetical protein JW937_09345 [Candidatus Omnitrophica bacterium]|nr:hypothetical protein [Candidatus Omnitrophota bacterium]